MTINRHAAAEIGHVSRCVHLDAESGHRRDVPQAPGAEPDRRVRWCLVPRLDQTLGVRVPDVRAVWSWSAALSASTARVSIADAGRQL